MVMSSGDILMLNCGERRDQRIGIERTAKQTNIPACGGSPRPGAPIIVGNGPGVCCAESGGRGPGGLITDDGG